MDKKKILIFHHDDLDGQASAAIIIQAKRQTHTFQCEPMARFGVFATKDFANLEAVMAAPQEAGMGGTSAVM